MIGSPVMSDEPVRSGAPLPAGKLAPGLLGPWLASIAQRPDVLVGPGVGRDVAIVDPGGDELWVLTADPITFTSDAIARYAVTVNANDVATAGAVPRWFLATVLLPQGDSRASDALALLAELREACAAQGVALVGGHTEITPAVDRPVIAGAMVGQVPRHALVRNDGVRLGDVVLCTKGVPLEGAAILAREHAGPLRAAGVTEEAIRTCAGYLDDPGLSVVAEARAACAAARVHAMHDPTEGGLATALEELARAADLGLRIEAEALPVLEPARRVCAALGLDPLGVIASGALLLAVAAGDAEAVCAAVRAQGVPCVRVATAVPAGEGVRLVRAGRLEPLPRFARDELARLGAAPAPPAGATGSLVSNGNDGRPAPDREEES